MELASSQDSESRFAAYVQELTAVIGHADRARPLSDYCQGLLLPCERKSVEPLAAATAPSRVLRSISLCCICWRGAVVG
jgi:SRSO17 transposase